LETFTNILFQKVGLTPISSLLFHGVLAFFPFKGVGVSAFSSSSLSSKSAFALPQMAFFNCSYFFFGVASRISHKRN